MVNPIEKLQDMLTKRIAAEKKGVGHLEGAKKEACEKIIQNAFAETGTILLDTSASTADQISNDSILTEMMGNLGKIFDIELYDDPDTAALLTEWIGWRTVNLFYELRDLQTLQNYKNIRSEKDPVKFIQLANEFAHRKKTDQELYSDFIFARMLLDLYSGNKNLPEELIEQTQEVFYKLDKIYLSEADAKRHLAVEKNIDNEIKRRRYGKTSG